jgi:hypothetical protein
MRTERARKLRSKNEELVNKIVQLEGARARAANLCNDFEEAGSLLVPIASIRAALMYKTREPS